MCGGAEERIWQQVEKKKELRIGMGSYTRSVEFKAYITLNKLRG